MGVLLVCLVAVILLQPTEGCSQITDFTLFDPNNPDAQESCQKCPKCQPGRGLAIQCGSRVQNGTFTGCKQCEVNKTYSENNDISHCKPCNQCGFKIVLQQCTPMQNSKCADACIPGYKLDPLLDACFVIPGNTTTTTSTKSTMASTKSPTTTQVPTAIPSLAPTTTNTTTTSTKSTVTSTKSPTTTQVPTAIPLLAPTTRSTETSAQVGRTAINTTNSTTVDPRTKLQCKHVHVNGYSTLSLVLIVVGCLGGVVFICFIIYMANKLRQSYCKTAVRSYEGAERGEELPLTEFQNKDHFVNKPPNDNGRTTPPQEDHSHKNSATTSSTESVPADNEQSTGDDNPNLDVQRIPKDCVVSDMEKLRKNNQVMLHSIQKKLDVRETIQHKTWRGLGRALGVGSEDLNLIETQFYQALQSPTESLVALLKTRSEAEPSMREFVRALIACARGDVARIIIEWPWWEMTGDRLGNDSG